MPSPEYPPFKGKPTPVPEFTDKELSKIIALGPARLTLPKSYRDTIPTDQSIEDQVNAILQTPSTSPGAYGKDWENFVRVVRKSLYFIKSGQILGDANRCCVCGRSPNYKLNAYWCDDPLCNTYRNAARSMLPRDQREPSPYVFIMLALRAMQALENAGTLNTRSANITNTTISQKTAQHKCRLCGNNTTVLSNDQLCPRCVCCYQNWQTKQSNNPSLIVQIANERKRTLEQEARKAQRRRDIFLGKIRPKMQRLIPGTFGKDPFDPRE